MITFVALIVIYMIFVLLDYQGGIDSFIGTTLFQPIIGGLISIATIAICLLVGLPIRIRDRINTWWTKRIWLSMLATLAGLFLFVLSLLPSMMKTINVTIEDEIIQKQIPNIGLATAGWFLTGFSLLHLFPPYRFRTWLEEVINRYTGRRHEHRV
jgi:hypothetical protein